MTRAEIVGKVLLMKTSPLWSSDPLHAVVRIGNDALVRESNLGPVPSRMVERPFESIMFILLGKRRLVCGTVSV